MFVWYIIDMFSWRGGGVGWVGFESRFDASQVKVENTISFMDIRLMEDIL